MADKRRFRRQAPKVRALLEAAQAAEAEVPEGPARRALARALDAFLLPSKATDGNSRGWIPLRGDYRLGPVRPDAELAAWQEIGADYAQALHEADLAVEECHQALAAAWHGLPNRVGIEWIAYRERQSDWKRGALRPVIYRADRKARLMRLPGAEPVLRYVGTEIPLERFRATSTASAKRAGDDLAEFQRDALVALREILCAREEVFARLAGVITSAAYWERPVTGGRVVLDRALAAVAALRGRTAFFAAAARPGSKRAPVGALAPEGRAGAGSQKDCRVSADDS